MSSEEALNTQVGFRIWSSRASQETMLESTPGSFEIDLVNWETNVSPNEEEPVTTSHQLVDVNTFESHNAFLKHMGWNNETTYCPVM